MSHLAIESLVASQLELTRTHDLTNVNPVVLIRYRGPHGSLISRAASSTQSGQTRGLQLLFPLYLILFFTLFFPTDFETEQIIIELDRVQPMSVIPNGIHLLRADQGPSGFFPV